MNRVTCRMWSSLVLALVLLAPSRASSTTFKFIYMSGNASTERVRVSIDTGSFSGCGGCNQKNAQIQISPCPSGKPCTNGIYSFQTNNLFMDIDLDVGTTYTFNGNFSWYSGRSAAQCNECGGADLLSEAQYTPSGPARWDISTTSIDGDVMWVELSLQNFHGPESDCARQSACMRNEFVCRISPCPLPYYLPEQCNNGIFFDPSPGTVRSYALQVGMTYTIWGDAKAYGLRNESHGGCYEPNGCNFSEPITSRTFTASTVATKPITWGAVKAMYRE